MRVMASTHWRAYSTRVVRMCAARGGCGSVSALPTTTVIGSAAALRHPSRSGRMTLGAPSGPSRTVTSFWP
jgi:hypothetical protein